jgi:uncharacterized protein
MGSGSAAKLGLMGLLMALTPGLALGCSTDRLDIRWQSGKASFAIEVADDQDERAKGLMFREKMAMSAGMLFAYEAPRRASFWMKNTLIPLDMIFADPAGKVTAVHANAVPGDLTSIDGGEGVQYIVEINGGLAKRLGIAPGAELQHPLIAQATAAWPCGN